MKFRREITHKHTHIDLHLQAQQQIHTHAHIELCNYVTMYTCEIAFVHADEQQTLK